jgi:hypothetical protein
MDLGAGLMQKAQVHTVTGPPCSVWTTQDAYIAPVAVKHTPRYTQLKNLAFSVFLSSSSRLNHCVPVDWGFFLLERQRNKSKVVAGGFQRTESRALNCDQWLLAAGIVLAAGGGKNWLQRTTLLFLP